MGINLKLDSVVHEICEILPEIFESGDEVTGRFFYESLDYLEDRYTTACDIMDAV